VTGFWIASQNQVSPVGSLIDALRAGRYDDLPNARGTRYQRVTPTQPRRENVAQQETRPR